MLVEKLEDLYAFSYKPDYDSDIDGWSFYSAEVWSEFCNFLRYRFNFF